LNTLNILNGTQFAALTVIRVTLFNSLNFKRGTEFTNLNIIVGTQFNLFRKKINSFGTQFTYTRKPNIENGQRCRVVVSRVVRTKISAGRRVGSAQKGRGGVHTTRT
jgi:hypothetical protein